MPLYVAVDEGAEGQHGEAAGASVAKRELDQATAQPLPFEAIADLGVDEGEQARAQAVLGEAGEIAVDADLVALLLGVIGDRDLWLGQRRILAQESPGPTPPPCKAAPRPPPPGSRRRR